MRICEQSSYRQVKPPFGRLVAPIGLLLATFAANEADFNVRDFGAKGDGETKDTVAVPRCRGNRVEMRMMFLFGLPGEDDMNAAP